MRISDWSSDVCSSDLDVRGDNVTPVPGGNRFDVAVRDRSGASRTITGLMLPMPGRHNVQNALAAVAVAIELGIDDGSIRDGFARFGGVKRRFTKVRPDARRVGKEGVSTCRSRWAPST